MFSIRLKELRKKKGLTQKEAALQLSIPRTTYSGYERGTSEPDFNTLNKLARFYEVDSNWLLGDKKESEYTLPEEIMVRIIKEAEEEFKVSLRDDPVVESAVRELVQHLAKMKMSVNKKNQ
ncbi:helix-turn-helix domain-containing protein [Paenibacillus jilunlii]|uniref:DNA-binding transcriptional regulator, XRE-family HTH domain n=1 Tax=Paenibacillus jilunlii TaxID=682956 RepID=A0A1H0A4X1_9BACL|nr:helix-turn-helix transcriptional regulator [Paenibacillus jilunlii]SDN28274.1 DNA-binding transcriptional regulator, XRE-family HTH domain [Paenibacillus jilunlii]